MPNYNKESQMDIKERIQDTFDDLCNYIFVELQKTTNEELIEAMSRIINSVPDKESGLRIFLECVKQYVENIILKESDLCEYDFDTGMTIIMNQKYQDMKTNADNQQKDFIVTFHLKQDKKVCSKFIIKDSFRVLDMCYLVMSNMHIGDFLHIYFKLPAREYRDENTITRLPEYEFELEKQELLSDLDIGIEDIFSILLKDDNGIVKYEIFATIEDIIDSQTPDSPFILLDHGYSGPGLPMNEKENYKNQELDDEIITVMFLYEKMYYERPDLYGQLADDLSNIMELGLIMYQDEEVENEDLDDTSNINPSLMN